MSNEMQDDEYRTSKSELKNRNKEATLVSGCF